ncbi:MFS transporter [Streptomyces sp. NPDC004111]|uniref:MFS transporter n=1 Tax=Streptomyces sp. NPDC004111 TaxID=3364690 RepID=UPI0036C3B8FD
MSDKASYAAVLRTPQASRTFAAALLGRLSYGVLPLSLVLSVKGATGSYAVSGAVSAVFGACSVLLSPARAALVDRFGPRRALVPISAVYALLLCVLALVCWTPGTPALLIGVTAAATGCCCPPLGPTMRMLWSRLMPDRAMLQRAYSLDGVAEELLFMAGPLIVGALVVAASPPAGLLLAAGLVLVGPAAMVASPVAAYTDRDTSGAGGATKGRGRIPGLALPVAVAFGAGIVLGGAELLSVAFTEGRGRPEAVAWVLAGLSVGSAVGGLANGAVNWRSRARPRLAFTGLALGLALSAAGLSPGVPVLVAAAVVTGLFIAPVITGAYLIADEAAGAGSRTRAGAWVNAGMNGGSSIGTAAVGLLVGRLPLPLCFVLVAVPVLCSAAVGLLARSQGSKGSRRSEGRQGQGERGAAQGGQSSASVSEADDGSVPAVPRPSSPADPDVPAARSSSES